MKKFALKMSQTNDTKAEFLNSDSTDDVSGWGSSISSNFSSPDIRLQVKPTNNTQTRLDESAEEQHTAGSRGNTSTAESYASASTGSKNILTVDQFHRSETISSGLDFLDEDDVDEEIILSISKASSVASSIDSKTSSDAVTEDIPAERQTSSIFAPDDSDDVFVPTDRQTDDVTSAEYKSLNSLEGNEAQNKSDLDSVGRHADPVTGSAMSSAIGAETVSTDSTSEFTLVPSTDLSKHASTFAAENPEPRKQGLVFEEDDEEEFFPIRSLADSREGDNDKGAIDSKGGELCQQPSRVEKLAGISDLLEDDSSEPIEIFFNKRRPADSETNIEDLTRSTGTVPTSDIISAKSCPMDAQDAGLCIEEVRNDAEKQELFRFPDQNIVETTSSDLTKPSDGPLRNVSKDRVPLDVVSKNVSGASHAGLKFSERPIAKYVNGKLLTYTFTKQRRYTQNSIVEKRIGVLAFFKVEKIDKSTVTLKNPSLLNVLKAGGCEKYLPPLELVKEDVSFTVDKQLFNNSVTGNFVLADINFIASALESHIVCPAKFELLKAKMGLEFVLKRMPEDCARLVLNLNNPSITRAFLRSQRNFILYFAIFYKCGIVKICDYLGYFHNNAYYLLVLDAINKREDLSLIQLQHADSKEKGKDEWGIMSVLDFGISKILNVGIDGTADSSAKGSARDQGSPLSIFSAPTFSRHKDIERYSSPVPEGSKKTSPNIGLGKVPSGIGSHKSVIPLTPKSGLQSTSTTQPCVLPNAAGQRGSEECTADAKPSLIEVPKEDLEAKMKDPTDVANINGYGKEDRSSMFDETEDVDLFDFNEKSKSTPNSPKLDFAEDNDQMTLHQSKSTDHLDEAGSLFKAAMYTHSNASSVSISTSDSEPVMAEKAMNSVVERTERLEVSSNSNQNDNIHHEDSTRTLPETALTDEQELRPNDVYANSKNSKSSTDISNPAKYKKKFSKSFADIFTLEGKTEASSADISTYADDVGENEKPISFLSPKDGGSVISSIFGIFKKKEQPEARPELERFNRPSKAEIKPPSKERTVNKGLYANKKGTNEGDIPGFKTKRD